MIFTGQQVLYVVSMAFRGHFGNHLNAPRVSVWSHIPFRERLRKWARLVVFHIYLVNT